MMPSSCTGTFLKRPLLSFYFSRLPPTIRDPRNPAAPLRTHASTHSDDITSVQFSRSPESSHVLLSASSDGLLCTTDAREDDEDEAGLHVGNWGCSIAQSGWVRGNTNTRGIWAASDMETFSVWTGELDQAQNIDIREPSVHRQDLTWVTDYLIGGHNRSTILPDHDNDLVVFSGSNEGDIAMLTRPTFSNVNQPWHLHSLWTMNHIGVVRSCLWDEQNNVLITGGEDAKINIWSGPSTSSISADIGSKRENISFEMDVDEEVGSPSSKKRRF
ncbi:hypothetical protein NLI96_g9131 [Meripilus lineatus]|uniref:Uncharacterized protein n=1 Tax=Meripilus lineatus TaxID=2056292 RepID=A0AAD5YD81_9APHY|nr:hypothetical protein NLI96_g9131 [Physisporinus lineatus]